MSDTAWLEDTPDWLGRSILVVDDVKTEGIIIKSLLVKLADCEVTHVTDPYEAIVHCAKIQFDILLLGYHLNSSLNGAELLHVLRERNLIRPQAAILFSSSDRAKQVSVSCTDLGADYFLPKPYSLNTFKNAMASAWRRSQSRTLVYRCMDRGDVDSAISICEEQLLESEWDESLLKLMISLQLEYKSHATALAVIEKISERVDSPYLIIAKAKLLAKDGNIDLAIDMILEIIGENPYIIEAFDAILTLLILADRHEEALFHCHSALQLTPSSSPRALQLAKTALQVKDIEMFLHAGRKLSKHLPIVTTQCIEYYCEYLDLVVRFYDEGNSDLQQQLIADVNVTYQLVKERIRPSQHYKIEFLYKTFIVCLTMDSSSDFELRQQFFSALPQRWKKLKSIPTDILINLVKPLLLIGDLELATYVLQHITKTNFSTECRKRLTYLQEQNVFWGGVKLLRKRIKQVQRDGFSEEAQLLLEQYPLSIELNLLNIEGLLEKGAFTSPKLKSSVRLIEATSVLSDEQRQKKEALLSHYFGYLKKRST